MMGDKEYAEYVRLFEIAENAYRSGDQEMADEYYEKANAAFEAYEYASGMKREYY